MTRLVCVALLAIFFVANGSMSSGREPGTLNLLRTPPAESTYKQRIGESNPYNDDGSLRTYDRPTNTPGAPKPLADAYKERAALWRNRAQVSQNNVDRLSKTISDFDRVLADPRSFVLAKYQGTFAAMQSQGATQEQINQEIRRLTNQVAADYSEYRKKAIDSEVSWQVGAAMSRREARIYSEKARQTESNSQQSQQSQQSQRQLISPSHAGGSGWH